MKLAFSSFSASPLRSHALGLSVFTVLAVGTSAALVACGGATQTVLSSDAGQAADAKGSTTTGPDSGVTTGPDGGTVTPAQCKVAHDCNEDQAVSSNLGACENGKCVCPPPSTYTAGGKCTREAPTTGQCAFYGGTCTGGLGAPGDPVCPNAILLQSTGGATTGCDTTKHEVCCIPSCGGKLPKDADFDCIRPQDGCADAACFGGTTLGCPDGTSKSAKGFGCGG